ncbi:hypothetical protein EMIHUDRAFT_207277 [Emiliania huxleyi CCMP1516]|uniref:Uncharacterized protein n=2 Tax=Emiliania huxleyi TaxID=2903 RepID=A0A0D3JF65_EMIH1|nr:hypothetical protein EMIHUDRAFT_207277 [Emiliania huxleyi CCMP1516]EOD22150.1 hypothetical protein EMIHUDRAFT_207277 [Emiliania huxleyi CCMP1516]|eukprot:XP_005774579.1 hypothetical protein EMIHUDRAFT_207277 [Emiliania huxleyi CCMP1516]
MTALPSVGKAGDPRRAMANTDGRGVSAVHADPAMLESLIIHRNRALQHGRMPPVLRDARACGGCFERAHCALAHAALEGGDAASFGVEALFLEAAGNCA